MITTADQCNRSNHRVALIKGRPVYSGCRRYSAMKLEFILLCFCLDVFLNFGQRFLVVFGAVSTSSSGYGQHELIQAGFRWAALAASLKCAQLGLKFRVGFDDQPSKACGYRSCGRRTCRCCRSVRRRASRKSWSMSCVWCARSVVLGSLRICSSLAMRSRENLT